MGTKIKLDGQRLFTVDCPTQNILEIRSTLSEVEHLDRQTNMTFPHAFTSSTLSRPKECIKMSRLHHLGRILCPPPPPRNVKLKIILSHCDSRQGQWFFVLFATASRPTLRPILLPIQWVQVGGVFPRGESDRGLKLTIYLDLVPSLRISGDTPPLPQYVYIGVLLN
jgi:hypothetical protein